MAVCTRTLMDSPVSDLDDLETNLHSRPILSHKLFSRYFELLSESLNNPYNRDWHEANYQMTRFVKRNIDNHILLKSWANLLLESENCMLMMLRWINNIPMTNKYKQYLVSQAFATVDYDLMESAVDAEYVKAIGSRGFTSLHFAAMKGHERNVGFLLSRGADPNIMDDQGRIPLFLTENVTCVVLLLQYGADVQSIDFVGRTAFESNSYSFEKREILQAHLAILEAKGVTIDPLIYKKVKSKFTYQRYRDQLNRMKTHGLMNDVTLFEALVDKPKIWLRYARESKNVDTIDSYCIEREIDWYYRFLLTNDYYEAMAKCDVTDAIVEVMSEITGRLVDAEHLVVENIANYIDLKYLVTLSSSL